MRLGYAERMFDRTLNMLNGLPGLVAYLDRDLCYVFANEAHRGWRGHTPESLVGRPVLEFVPDQNRTDVMGHFARALDGESVQHEVDIPEDGLCVRISYAPDFDHSGFVVGVIAGVTDLSEMKKIERELRNSQRTFDGAFENTAIGKAILGMTGECLRVNASLAQMLGYEIDELTGLNLGDLNHPDDFAISTSLYYAALSGEREGYQIEKRYRHRDGHWIFALLAVSPVRDDAGEVIHFVAEMMDITDRQALQESLHLQALTDHLTGLLNRRGFDHEFKAAAEAPFGVLMIDLDHFKPVNDRFGHAAGDAVLVEAGRRIRGNVRESDKVARVGGDEFAVFLKGATRNQVEQAADRLVRTLAEPFEVEDETIIIGASVGAVHQLDGKATARELLHRADEGLYHVKETGRGRWQIAAKRGAGKRSRT
jgi:diguanylate cyclase (GGDEF)-like protein/PAS domain S-box-containing protein